LVELGMTGKPHRRISWTRHGGWHPRFEAPIEHRRPADRREIMKTLALATAAFGLALTAAPALAGAGELPTKVVEIAGLDLDTTEGQRMLDQRIERAARDVCRYDEERVGTRIRSNESRACLAKARAGAQQQVATIIENQRRGG
jgi:UrcA family protein